MALNSKQFATVNQDPDVRALRNIIFIQKYQENNFY